MLKLSGEVLGGDAERGINAESFHRIADEIAQLNSQGIRLGIVPGGGNFLRGRDVAFIERVSADRVAMTSTILNGLALQAALDQKGIESIIQCPFSFAFADPINPRRARQALDQGQVVIFVGGVGEPLVSTDMASAIRAVEIKAQLLLKASNIDGVYNKDPDKHPDAKRFETVSFEEVIENRLQVMDLVAFDICCQQQIPILVFDVRTPGNMTQVMENPKLGTLIH